LDGDDGRGHPNCTECELSVLDRTGGAALEVEAFQIGHDKMLAAVITVRN
jgi:hypothetical protein